MKKIIKAFTLVELIVVISIITLLTASSVFYFLDFVEEQKISQKLMIVEDNIADLDKKVKTYEIFDYELQFSLSNTWSYITYVNNFDIPYNQIINYDSNNWIWTISTDWTSSENWNIKLYKKQKLYLNENRAADNDYTNLDLSTESYYKITWTLSWSVLNEIHLNYFSTDNIYPEKNDLLLLSNINTKEDKSWTDYSSIIINNIWWNKTIWTNEDEIFLFFENNWKEKFIKITK